MTDMSADREMSAIDPIYLEYTKGVIRTLADTEFYQFFMDWISTSDNEFQFSNRRVEKIVDIKWVEAMEEALPALQNIIATPRNVLFEEELTVNIAHAKKCEPASVRHLSQHGSLVDEFDEDAGDVRPNKLMQKFRDETLEIYENRLVITVLENAHRFVQIRYDALSSALSDEYGAKLKLKSDMEGMTEHVRMDMFLHIKEKDDILSTDNKHRDIFERISRLHRVLTVFINSPFAQSLIKATRIKGTIVKTNVLKKNPNYKAIVKLYEFLHSYADVGYGMKVIEQNPEINETFQKDIYHGVMFNYIILKNYLEDEKGRAISTEEPAKRTEFKPKFIKEIIEELTDNYDLPDVEIRKVLIEELTKAQLMKEEAEERRRLVEERAQRKREEAERLREEKRAERERLRQEKLAEQERIRMEKEAERARLEVERLERDLEDNIRGNMFRHELDHLANRLGSHLIAREEEMARQQAAVSKQDFADAVQVLEEQERLRAEQEERERIRREEERARELWEKRQEELRLAAEEEARRAAERARKEEERRAAEEQQRAEDRVVIAAQIAELNTFRQMIERNSRLRQNKNGGERR